MNLLTTLLAHRLLINGSDAKEDAVNVIQVLKLLSGEAGGCRDLDECEAHELMAMILDAGTGELELGAVLALLEQKSLTLP